MQDEIEILDPAQHDTWRTVNRAQANISAAIDKELTDAHSVGLADFEVLSFLAESSDSSLRMTELARGVLLSPSGLTRRLDGLVRQGYVERKPAPSDGRGLLAVLTDNGRQKVQEMMPTHSRGLKRHFIDCLQPTQLKEINEMFHQIAQDETCVAS